MPDPALSSVSVKFATTSDDKDWDTNVKVWVKVGGIDIATLDCCSADRVNDHFPNNSTIEKTLTLVAAGLTKSSVQSGRIIIGETPHGDDTWVFIPTLIFSYADGTNNSFTFPEVVLAGSHSNYTDAGFNWP